MDGTQFLPTPNSDSRLLNSFCFDSDNKGRPLKFEELPGTPGIWLDFLQSKIPLLTAPSGVKSLTAHVNAVVRRRTRNDFIRALAGRESEASQVFKNIQRLAQPDSVAVITEIRAGLFGGPVVHILKCLTAIKLCEELAKDGVDAIPICWISSQNSSERGVSLIDADGEIHSMEISHGETIPGHFPAIISQIRKFGGGGFDEGILGMLESAFLPGHSFPSASARLISALMKPWGMIVCDPGAPESREILSEAVAPLQTRAFQFPVQGTSATLAGLGNGLFPGTGVPASLIQSSLFPVVARVVDPFEMCSLANVLPVFEKIDLVPPIVWPEASTTVGDVRSRRTLSRYDLNLMQLYSGEEEVLRSLREALPRAAPDKLRTIKFEVETQILQLKSLISLESGFVETADSCKEKILYQIERLEHLAEAALNEKERTASRHIHQVCNLLAPNGRLQERELAAIQIPLRYTIEGLQRLYEKLDILNFEHQLIWMD
jgi:uncharacterized protein YllA (UPF0747 family)